jgi:hypothetical protein
MRRRACQGLDDHAWGNAAGTIMHLHLTFSRTGQQQQIDLVDAFLPGGELEAVWQAWLRAMLACSSPEPM